MLKDGPLYRKLYERGSLEDTARLRRESFAGVIFLAHRFEYILNDALSETGLTTMQVMVLAAIMREDEPPSPSRVAATLKVSYQNVMQMARLLKKKGFIEMERDPTDKRAYRLVPTPHSNAVFEGRLEADADLLSRMFDVLTDVEQKRFFELLVKLLDHNNGLYDDLKART